MRLPLSLFFAALLAFMSALAQTPTPVARPLGDTLTIALQNLSLTTPGSHPFHVRMHIHDVTTDSDLATQADIEEFWMSPVLWKRTIITAGLRQTTVVNETGAHVENTGEYFPLWIRGFVTALFDPVPNLASWNQPGAELRSVMLSSGHLSAPCVIQQQRFGDNSQSIQASLCFFGGGELSYVDTADYSMEFNLFAEFHKKHVPYLYMSHQQPGHVMVGKIEKLEDFNKPSAFFIASPEAQSFDSLASIPLDQSQIKRLISVPPSINWPAVHRGKTDGAVTMFLSMDRTGKIREARVVTSDNRELNQTVLRFFKNQQCKVAASKGNPTQVVGALTVPFSTSSVPGEASPEQSTSLILPAAVQSGHKISGTNPNYPPDAKAQRISGSVYLQALISKDGTVAKIGVIDSPSPILTKASMDAVRTWKYTPYLLDGVPVSVDTTITVNFNFR
jgi:TonB family protein